MRWKSSSVVAVVGSVLASTAISAHAAQPDYDNYVALGDSYTSGPLIPFQRLFPLGCLRSTRNYPSILADTLRVKSFTDASCAGADTTNMTSPQSVPLGRNAPQLDSLRAHTDLVSLGIGGNDYSVFGTVIKTCIGLRASDPTGHPCQDKFTVDGTDTLKAKIADTQQNIVRTLAAVHQRSPHAEVVVLGYPKIAPDTGYCPDRLPLADGDYRWADSVERTLNTAIANAVDTDGQARYVDTYTPSIGHDVCAQNGAAWINGVALRLLAAAPVHPFESGMVAEASLVSHALGVQRPVRIPAPSGEATATTQQLREVHSQASIH